MVRCHLAFEILQCRDQLLLGCQQLEQGRRVSFFDDAPLALASSLGTPFRVIECVCADEIACARLAADHAAGTHSAGNRTPDLYTRAKTAAVPLTVARLTLDTGALSAEECVRRAVEYVRL